MATNETHLQMIQGVISRMAGNSFMLKGWAVTLISAVFALAAQGANPRIAFVAYLPAVTFWLLDAYYLWQERLFRRLYDATRSAHPPAGDTTDFSMNAYAAAQAAPAPDGRKLMYRSSLMSVTEAGFYLPLLAVISAGAWVVGAFR